jgi:hypothetical protein
MRKLFLALVVLAFFPVSCATSSQPPNNLVDVLEAEAASRCCFRSFATMPP